MANFIHFLRFSKLCFASGNTLPKHNECNLRQLFRSPLSLEKFLIFCTCFFYIWEIHNYFGKVFSLCLALGNTRLKLNECDLRQCFKSFLFSEKFLVFSAYTFFWGGELTTTFQKKFLVFRMSIFFYLFVF